MMTTSIATGPGRRGGRFADPGRDGNKRRSMVETSAAVGTQVAQSGKLCHRADERMNGRVFRLSRGGVALSESE